MKKEFGFSMAAAIFAGWLRTKKKRQRQLARPVKTTIVESGRLSGKISRELWKLWNM